MVRGQAGDGEAEAAPGRLREEGQGSHRAGEVHVRQVDGGKGRPGLDRAQGLHAGEEPHQRGALRGPRQGQGEDRRGGLRQEAGRHEGPQPEPGAEADALREVRRGRHHPQELLRHGRAVLPLREGDRDHQRVRHQGQQHHQEAGAGGVRGGPRRPPERRLPGRRPHPGEDPRGREGRLGHREGQPGHALPCAVLQAGLLLDGGAEPSGRVRQRGLRRGPNGEAG
mmetsp:Transcript_141276/g.439063  ORF Transcript_141276/g.439063 Transcript_141276/m.439063 type:complete len:225 (+) Transcript_141276:4548-5222(+)